MRRADRLFQIVQFLRSRRLTTAQWLAERLQVSVRTIYRDIQDLSLSGVPLEGEAGVGYVLRQPMDLPPLMFEREEIEALLVGVRMVNAWADPQLQRAAESALAKIHGVLPASLRDEFNSNLLLAPETRPYSLHWLGQLRQAIRRRRRLRVSYRSENGETTERFIQPLGLFFWGQAWTLCCWCELRNDFRSLRVDRVLTLEDCGETFEPNAGQRLEDYLALHVCAELLVPSYKS
ncbi:YafY family transcriptional regulator [Pseudomonas sp. CrR25]|nr:YafY family transcriptional regulator [Pseudomonas sp. CrR25]